MADHGIVDRALWFSTCNYFVSCGSGSRRWQIKDSASLTLFKMLNIRRARQEDCQFIGSVHRAAVGGIRTGLYKPEELQAWAVPRKPESYEELISSREFLVAVVDEVIVGFGVLNQSSAEVEAVYVSPAAGQRGIGLKLLQKLEESASMLGLKMLRLNASLNAVQFYEKAGYVAEEQSKYRLLTGVEIACVPMVKSLTALS